MDPLDPIRRTTTIMQRISWAIFGCIAVALIVSTILRTYGRDSNPSNSAAYVTVLAACLLLAAFWVLVVFNFPTRMTVSSVRRATGLRDVWAAATRASPASLADLAEGSDVDTIPRSIAIAAGTDGITVWYPVNPPLLLRTIHWSSVRGVALLTAHRDNVAFDLEGAAQPLVVRFRGESWFGLPYVSRQRATKILEKLERLRAEG
jgi:hypothetical protein